MRYIRVFTTCWFSKENKDSFFAIFNMSTMLSLLTILSLELMVLVRYLIYHIMVSPLVHFFEFVKTWVVYLGCHGLLINRLPCYGIISIGVAKNNLPQKPI